jgi:hypothetical protein
VEQLSTAQFISQGQTGQAKERLPQDHSTTGEMEKVGFPGMTDSPVITRYVAGMAQWLLSQ